MFSLLLLFLFQGCTGKIPIKEELIGNWINSDSAIINLKKDGTFTAKKLPVEFFILEDYKGKQFDGNGEWTLKKGKTYWEVYLEFNKILNKEYSYGHTMLISGEKGILENKPPWYLFTWKDEPGGERFVFKRK